jgi:PKHD-type hydroxylase
MEWILIEDGLPSTIFNKLKVDIARLKYKDVSFSLDGRKVTDLYRSCTAAFLDDLYGDFDYVRRELWKIASGINDSHFQYDIGGMPPPQISKYSDSSSGHYDVHQDHYFGRNQGEEHRKLTLIVQLSEGESYSGGDIDLLDVVERPPRESVRKIGSVLVFPSCLRHSVSCVTKGERISMVCWFTGPPWR